MHPVLLLSRSQIVVLDVPAVALHPNATGLYAAGTADLVAALNEPEMATDEMATDAIGAIYCLVQQIVLTPNEEAPSKLSAELHSNLALILPPARPRRGCRAGGNPALVLETGNNRDRTPIHAAH